MSYKKTLPIQNNDITHISTEEDLFSLITSEDGIPLLSEDSGLFLVDDKGIYLHDYTLTLPRMGIPNITATIKYPKCLDKLWTLKEYVEINGEKYYLNKTPTSSKDNSDAVYSHELEFTSERNILSNVYFYDVVPKSLTSDLTTKPVSNSTEFKFYGTPKELISRLNCAFLFNKINDSAITDIFPNPTLNTELGKDGFCAIIDNTGDYDLEQSAEFDLSDQFIWDILTQSFEKFKIPFEFEGKTIYFGRKPQKINRTFKYQDSLLSVKKTNETERIVNRITFKGSSDNIPYYYPNETEYGNIKIETASFDESSLLNKLNPNLINVENYTQLFSLLRAGQKATLCVENKTPMYIDEQNSFQDVQFNDGISQLIDRLGLNFGYWDKFTSDISYKELKITWYIAFKTSIYATYNLSTLNGAMFAVGKTENTLPESLFNNLLSSSIIDSVWLRDARQSRIRECVVSLGNISLGQLTADTTYYVEVIFKKDLTSQLKSTHYYSYLNSVEITTPTEASKTNYYWKIDGKNYLFGELGISYSGTLDNTLRNSTLWWTAISRIPFQTNLMPPLYRDTNGTERFYVALNNKYIKADGSYYAFESEYVDGNPKEYIYEDEDIKPTIDGITNANGELFGEIVDIAYDSDDNDLLKNGTNEDTSSTALDYQHSFFYIKLHIFDGDYGFDLFKSASQQNAMTLQMTSGNCNGCKFKVQTLEYEDDNGLKSFKNPVQVDSNGNIVPGSYSNKVKKQPQSEQQNTMTNSIWICVQKDVETFGVIIPNKEHRYLPQKKDKFNIIYIDLPEQYILAAEKKGEQKMLEKLEEMNVEQFSFDISLSRVFLSKNTSLIPTLKENNRVVINYDNKIYERDISEIQYICKSEEILPEIKITLTNENY